jgi:antirestriction protein ArdC
MQQDIRDTIAQRFIDALNGGVIPWRKPWSGGMLGRPHNAQSKKPYRGSNALFLGMLQLIKSYPTGQWVTFKGCNALGGRINTGEKATPIMFWNFKEVADKATGEKKTIPMLRWYNVWNLAQTNGCNVKVEEVKAKEPIAAAESVVRGMKNPPKITVQSSDMAFYTPSRDEITMPLLAQFVNAESYYSTMFHELAHSTGHATRLDRKLDGTFGTDPYSREELIAEMTAAFLSAECGILDAVQDNSTAYVQHWATRLGKEPRLILDAASAAQKAADHILGVTFAKESSEEQ